MERRGRDLEDRLGRDRQVAAQHLVDDTRVVEQRRVHRQPIRPLLDALYQLADDHLALLAGLFDGPTAMFHLGGTADDAPILTRLEYTEPFERLLRDGNHDGTLLSDRPRQDAELIFNTAGWTYIHLRRSHQWSAHRARVAVTQVATAFITPQLRG